MNYTIKHAIMNLNCKLKNCTLDGSIKIVIIDKGTLIINQNSATVGNTAADCTISANAETFQALLNGNINPITAFMNGGLSVEGNIMLAMQLGKILG